MVSEKFNNDEVLDLIDFCDLYRRGLHKTGDVVAEKIVESTYMLAAHLTWVDPDFFNYKELVEKFDKVLLAIVELSKDAGFKKVVLPIGHPDDLSSKFFKAHFLENPKKKEAFSGLSLRKAPYFRDHTQEGKVIRKMPLLEDNNDFKTVRGVFWIDRDTKRIWDWEKSPFFQQEREYVYERRSKTPKNLLL
ncbi:MAG: hypothetical protein MRY79_00220 [Alphaproteobacteria bacterium]|nr:hypothetical protein [Alphaproteobacteria bacterium]